MKRYERLITTAFLTVFLLAMTAPLCCQGAPRPRTGSRRPAVQCRAMKEKHYMKNRCEGGFITVFKKKVLLQQTGLSIDHPSAALVKETCTLPLRVGRGSEDSPLRGRGLGAEVDVPHLVRYRHVETNMYICFDKRGFVKARPESRVDQMGRLCMFEEHAVDRSYHTVRSHHNPSWHLGFNRGRVMRQRGQSAVMVRRGNATNVRSCEAHFHSGQHAPVNLARNFSGIFEQIEQLSRDSSSHTTVKDKAVVKVVSESGRADKEEEKEQDNAVDQNLLISRAQFEALRLQQILGKKKPGYRIRHLNSKQWPRPSRQEKMLAKMAAKDKL